MTTANEIQKYKKVTKTLNKHGYTAKFGIYLTEPTIFINKAHLKELRDVFPTIRFTYNI